MKRFIYTRPSENNQVSIVSPAAKWQIEKTTGPLTDKEYEERVKTKSTPVDAVNVRDIDDIDIPSDRELRNAWVDVTEESRIDIDCTKAKDIRLSQLRKIRDEALEKSDIEITRAMEDGNQADIDKLKVYRQELRDVTNPLKAEDTTGKYNDDVLLAQMKSLSENLPVDPVNA